MFFNTKFFGLQTAEEHMQLSFTNVVRQSRKCTTPRGTTKVVSIRYYAPVRQRKGRGMRLSPSLTFYTLCSFSWHPHHTSALPLASLCVCRKDEKQAFWYTVAGWLIIRGQLTACFSPSSFLGNLFACLLLREWGWAGSKPLVVSDQQGELRVNQNLFMIQTLHIKDWKHGSVRKTRPSHRAVSTWVWIPSSQVNLGMVAYVYNLELEQARWRWASSLELITS